MDKVYVIGRDPVPSLLRLDSPQELRLTFVALPGACGKVSVEVDIDSAGCSLDMAGLYLCSSDEQLGFDVLVRHNCGGSVSRQNFRGLVGGTARAAFNDICRRRGVHPRLHFRLPQRRRAFLHALQGDTGAGGPQAAENRIHRPGGVKAAGGLGRAGICKHRLTSRSISG